MKNSNYRHTIALLLLSSLSGCSQQQKSQDAQEQTMAQPQEATRRKKTDSGLEYEIIQAAQEDAQSPQQGNRVVVHYTGWLADENGEPVMDKKFDSSVDRGTPFTFMLGAGQVIKGWDEGLALMKVGEKRRLIIPADLGYGARGAGAVIPPNANLVFDVELLDIKA